MEKKERIAIVVHRYGEELCGGVEYHCRMLAKHMQNFYFVDVLTTKTKGVRPWDNAYSEDIEEKEGIRLLRFLVEDAEAFPEGSEERRGPYCPQLIEYLREEGRKYKAVIFYTLHCYTAIAGLKLRLPNAIFMPTAHKDRSLEMPEFDEVFSCAKGFLFNTPEEQQLVEERFGIKNVPSRQIWFGMESSDYQTENLENACCKEPFPYIVYVGRVSGSKNFRQLNEYFLAYKKQNPSDLKLVVLGEIDNYFLIRHHKDIIFKGFVAEEEKKIYMKNAKALVLPSRHESLSIAVLESLLLETPILVNGECDVLKGHCIRSGGGLYYENYPEFAAGLEYILENEECIKEMGISGRLYVQENYTWERTIKAVISLIEEILRKGETQI